MIKVVSAQEMVRLEKVAYARGAREEAFMEEAGRGVAEHAQRLIGERHLKPQITLLCGSGNNGGDALVAGRHLLRGGFQVVAWALAPYEKSSPLCQLQSKRFQESGGTIIYLQRGGVLSFDATALLIDGIFGTGFHGEVEGVFREVMEGANRSKKPILSIDIPSGVEGSTGKVAEGAILATETLFLGLPKSGCFLGSAWNHVGRVACYNFGLEKGILEEAKGIFLMVEKEEVLGFLPPLVRNRHKYQAGYVVGIAGSPEMPGAALLSCSAALRAGAGIVRLLYPEGMEVQLAHAPYELIKQGYDYNDVGRVLPEVERAGALFVGPGLGRREEARKWLQRVLEGYRKPCVVDADALQLLSYFPEGSILTPHQGEMHQLLGEKGKLGVGVLHRRTQEFSERHGVIVVLKGAPTFIFRPCGEPYVCPYGDPGMATAGAGDVLTGVIAAFLAEGVDPLKAALLGVVVHALAGERAAREKGSHSMIASDIIEELPRILK